MAEYIEREKVYEILNAALNEAHKLDGLFSEDYIRGCQNTLSIVTNDIQKIPSCQVGDIVYKIIYNHCCTCPDWDYYSIIKTNFQLNMISDINKTIFITRKEAEQALEILNGGGNNE